MASPDAGLTLRIGSRGPAVAEVQRRLTEHHQAPIDPPGHFGEDTELKVRRFQLKRGLLADGIVGPETMAALLTDDQEGANGSQD